MIYQYFFSAVFFLFIGFSAGPIYADEYDLGQGALEEARFDSGGGLFTLSVGSKTLRAWSRSVNSWLSSPLQFVFLEPGESIYQRHIDFKGRGGVGVYTLNPKVGDRIHDVSPNRLEAILQDRDGKFSYYGDGSQWLQRILKAPLGLELVDARMVSGGHVHFTLWDGENTSFRRVSTLNPAFSVDNADLEFSVLGRWRFQGNLYNRVLSNGEQTFQFDNWRDRAAIWTSEEINKSLQLFGRSEAHLEWVGEATNYHVFKAKSRKGWSLIVWDTYNKIAFPLTEEQETGQILCGFQDQYGGHFSLYYAYPGESHINLLTRVDIDERVQRGLNPRKIPTGFKLEKDSKIRFVKFSSLLMVNTLNQVKIWDTRRQSEVKSIKRNTPILDAVALPGGMDHALLVVDREGKLIVEELTSWGL